MKNKFSLLFLLIFVTSCSNPDANKKEPFNSSTNTNTPVVANTKNAQEIEYKLLEHPEGLAAFQGLSATFNNKDYEIIKPDEERCFDLFNIDDYNQDGYNDALVTAIVACGGNCCPNEFFLCFYDKENDTFIASENFGASWGEPIIEKGSGLPQIKLTENTQGYGFTKMEEITYWFILKKNEVDLLKSVERKQLDAKKEIRSSLLNEEEKENGSLLKIDINQDSVMDEIHADYWDRWGTLNWTVTLVGTDAPVLKGTGKRIGILSSSTNGVYDLINSFDEIYTWNGSEFKLKEK